MPPPAHRATVPRVEAVIDPALPAFVWTARTPILATADLAASVARLGGGGGGGDTELPPIRLCVDETLGAEACSGGPYRR